MERLVKVGDTYGRLVVVEHHHTDSHYRKFWVCRCSCGGSVITHSGSLRSGNTRSCGCLAKEVSARKRKPDNGGEVTAVILGYKRHAERRGFVWNLSRDQVRGMLATPCHYCGTEPKNKKVTKNSDKPFLYNGIDRVDNSLGYETSNVVPCCAVCNRAKGALTTQEFHAWIKRVDAMASQWGSAFCNHKAKQEGYDATN